MAVTSRRSLRLLGLRNEPDELESFGDLEIQAGGFTPDSKRLVTIDSAGEKVILWNTEPMGRLKLAEAELAQVAEWMPEDPEARFLGGRLKLAQAAAEKDEAVEDRLRGEAAEAFREAIQLDPDRPLPHRELGLLLYGEGELEEACAAFRRYGELAPDAEDAGRFRDYVLEIERDGRCP